MKIAILGLANEGMASYEYWNQPGNQISIRDKNVELEIPRGADSLLGADYLKNLGQFDLIVRTPALHPSEIVNANPETPDILSKVTSGTNEFFKVCPTGNIIGVTGTKGKGTTTTLIAKMLEADGKRVHLGGNIGIPALELLHREFKPEDWVVLELSSFQLMDLKYSPHIGVCLMVESEHMDWHEDFEEYIAAKQQLFMNQTEQDVAIYYAQNENSEAVVDVSEGELIAYMDKSGSGARVSDGAIVIDDQQICKTSEIKLLGKHNWQNLCAATTAVWQVTKNASAIKSVATSFSGLAYRLELVRELDGVNYYNDSFGTTPETAIVAIEAFAEPKIVIIGGSDKGSDYSKLIQAVVSQNVSHVITIGIIGKLINSKLQKAGYKGTVEGASTMSEIVKQAKNLSTPGDVVILSAACASFDMFKNYKDRGQQFTKAVQSL